MNSSANLLEVTGTTIPDSEFSSRTLSVVLWAVIAINAVGIVANAFLITGLMLLHGKGHISVASVQMLVQQASVDLILNALSIAYALKLTNYK